MSLKDKKSYKMADTDVDTHVGGNTAPQHNERSRGWTYTVNNWTDTDVIHVRALRKDSVWGVYQYERGAEGTPHIQGAVYYKNARALKSMKKMLPRAHLEPMRGTCSHSKEYCTKQDETFVAVGEEWGEMPEQGRRRDLETIATEVVQGKALDKVANDDPGTYVRYSKGLTMLRNTLQKHRSEPPTVYWLWGKAGTGKTRFAFDMFKPEEIYIKDGTMWWDNYEQQKCIVIDDFDGKWPFRDLLRLLDRYPYQGQVKGGYVKINSPFIVITCEYAPSTLYDVDANQLAQVTRRLHKITEIK